MNIKNILEKIQLPEIYKREGKECYFDTFRKKLIEITPEETVRQKVAQYFELFCGVPKDLIELEVPISYYVKGAKGRADIIIHKWDSNEKAKYPLAVIECKNEDVILTDRVAEQAVRYCNIIGGKYIIITNGVEMEIAAYQPETDKYVYLDEILAYEKMLGGDYTIPQSVEQVIERFSIGQLNNQYLIKQYNDEGAWIFGANTNSTIRTFAVNLYQCLLDVGHKLPAVKRNSFELLQDIGLTYMDYTNRAGGGFEGNYRAFLVKDRNSEIQKISISIFGTDANFRGENRNSYTSLVVAIDHFKTSHTSLEYNLDNYTKIYSNKIKFWHNGRISNKKSADVINFVKKNSPNLLANSGSIQLGILAIDRLFYLDDKNVAEFIYNLIEYALLREEFRNQMKTVQ